MSSEVYSNLKVLHDLDRLGKLRTGVDFFPRSVRIDLSTRCNHACYFCLYQSEGSGLKGLGLNDSMPPNRDIDGSRLIELIGEFEECGVEAVVLLGGGEPTLHPSFEAILERLTKSKLEFGVITNGSRLSRVLPYVAAPRFRWIRISLDAATPEMWQRVHSPGDADVGFEAIIGSISHVAAAAKKTGSPCVVGGSFVAGPVNYNEVLEFCRVAKHTGLDNVRIGIEYSKEVSRSQTLYAEQLRLSIRKARETLEDSTFRIFDKSESRLPDISTSIRDYDSCLFQSFSTNLGADLCFYTCCFGKYASALRIGSVEHRSFRQVWLEDRKEFLQRFLVSECPPCWYGSHNRSLQYMADPNPPHVKFVE